MTKGHFDATAEFRCQRHFFGVVCNSIRQPSAARFASVTTISASVGGQAHGASVVWPIGPTLVAEFEGFSVPSYRDNARRSEAREAGPASNLCTLFALLRKALALRECQKLMPWSRRFQKPLYLNDGRTIATLAEARDIMLALSRLEQTNPHWARAAELLMEAAYRSRKDPILDAGAQLSLALKADGLI